MNKKRILFLFVLALVFQVPFLNGIDAGVKSDSNNNKSFSRPILQVYSEAENTVISNNKRDDITCQGGYSNGSDKQKLENKTAICQNLLKVENVFSDGSLVYKNTVFWESSKNNIQLSGKRIVVHPKSAIFILHRAILI